MAHDHSRYLTPEKMRGGVVELEDLRGAVQPPANPRPQRVRTEVLADLRSRREAERDVSQRSFYDALIKAIGAKDLGVPAFPTTALELDELLREDNKATTRLIGLIEQDPALVTAVWACARTVSEGKQPGTLELAVKLIGLDQLWQLAFDIAMNSAVFRVRGYDDEAERIRQHGIIVGKVAGWMGDRGRGTHFIAGLLHDVGRLVVLHAAGRSRGARPPEKALLDELMDRHHASLGLVVGRVWRLPKTAVLGMGYHHHPELAPADARGVAALVRAADLAAHMVEERERGDVPMAASALRDLRGLPVSAKDLVRRAEMVTAVVRRASRAA